MLQLNKIVYFLTPTGYRVYRRTCQQVRAEADSEAQTLEGNIEKVKDFALENGAFESDENFGSKEKCSDATKNTQL